jgi:hypothetical protein
MRADTVSLADMLVRVGLGRSTEADIGWTPYVHERSRAASGIVERAAGVGDVTLAIRQNLHAPDGKGLAVALAPFIALPTGSGPGSAGDWGAGVVLPASLDLGGGLALQSTSELTATPDADRRGRHVMASQVVGLGIVLTDRWSLTAEGQLVRDWDPAGATTEAYGGLSLAFAVSGDLQLDVGTVAGLSRQAADVALYAGISRRF